MVVIRSRGCGGVVVGCGWVGWVTDWGVTCSLVLGGGVRGGVKIEEGGRWGVRGVGRVGACSWGGYAVGADGGVGGGDGLT